jgi:TPR repeat protein
MARSGPWSVKNVDEEARLLAREAAKKSGLTIGAWIDRAIRSRGGVEDDPAPASKEKSPQRKPPVRSAPRRKVSPGLPGKRIAIAAAFVIGIIGAGYWALERGYPAKFMAMNKTTEARPPAPAPRQIPSQATGTTSAPAEMPAIDADSLKKLVAAAEKGELRAQYKLGVLYMRGQSVARDPGKAAEWFEKAARKGLAAAQFNLGVLYEQGEGTKQNLVTAYDWYLKAAKLGYLRAQQNLGTLLVEGRGTRKNNAEALKWFSLAAQGGLAESLYSMGLMHEFGLGTKKNSEKAAGFYRKAMAAGSTLAAQKLGTVLVDPAPKAASSGPASPADNSLGTLDRNEVAELQKLLTRLDLSPGLDDGVLREQTITAIKMYQKFAGLTVNGKPSLELLIDLRQVAGAMIPGDGPGAIKTPSAP